MFNRESERESKCNQILLMPMTKGASYFTIHRGLPPLDHPASGEADPVTVRPEDTWNPFTPAQSRGWLYLRHVFP